MVEINDEYMSLTTGGEIIATGRFKASLDRAIQQRYRGERGPPVPRTHLNATRPIDRRDLT